MLFDFLAFQEGGSFGEAIAKIFALIAQTAIFIIIAIALVLILAIVLIAKAVKKRKKKNVKNVLLKRLINRLTALVIFPFITTLQWKNPKRKSFLSIL